MQKSVLFMGLGYIGLPTAALVADAGLQVTGVDINENVVNNINNCDISNQEPGLQEIVEKNIRNGRLKASLTPSPSDVFLIVVPTPFNEHPQPDRASEEELRPQQLWPHHRPPSRRRQQAQVPHHRLQARQDGFCHRAAPGV